MILEIQDPGWDFTSLFVTGGIAVVVLAIGLLTYLRLRDVMSESDTFGVWTLTVVIAAMALGAGVLVGNSVYDRAIQDEKIAGLEELGFDQVYLYGDNFTASRDGAYFSGVLLEGEEPDTWEVAEVLPPVPVEENEK